MSYTVRQIDKLPSDDALHALEAQVRSTSSTESTAREVLEQHPELLIPLEMAEFAAELRFRKRDRIDPSRNIHASENRIPDFNGVHIHPFSMPIVVELKGPNARILDRSTGYLTTGDKGAAHLINQLQEAMVHMLRPGGQQLLHEAFGHLPADVFDDETLELFASIDAQLSADSTVLIPVLKALSEAGVSIVGVIGTVREFGSNAEALKEARSEFERRGCTLVLWDELLAANTILCDYAARDSSLLDYFSNRMWESHDGHLKKFSDTKFLDDAVIADVQKKVFRITGDVCIFGIGPPPEPVAAWSVSAPFNIRMLWAKPTHLGGDERLLWAGRIDAAWVVFKERLTEPAKGGVVLYEFLPPSASTPPTV